MFEDKTSQIENISHLTRGQARFGVVEFLNNELRSASGFSIIEECPSLFGDFPGGESLVIRIKGQIASHVGYLAREFLGSDFRLKVGLLGSIATREEHRNRGLASQLVTRACTDLRKKGCAVAWLWSDNSEFYRPLGFYRMGREVDLRFSSQLLTSADAAIRFDIRKHLGMLWRLYQRHESKLDRSLEEQRRLCLIPKSEIYVTERNGSLTSYLAINKGADFLGYIHEWGGDIEQLCENIRAVQSSVYQGKSLTLISPAHYPIGPLRKMATMEWEGVLGLARVLDPASLINCFVQHLKRTGHAAQWLRESNIIEIDGAQLSFSTEEDLLRIVFGNANQVGTPTLPFFLWGFDSI